MAQRTTYEKRMEIPLLYDTEHISNACKVG